MPLEGNLLDVEAYAVYSESHVGASRAEFGQLSEEQTRYGLGGAMGRSLNFILIVIGSHWMILKSDMICFCCCCFLQCCSLGL